MTKDLAGLAEGLEPKTVNTEEFIKIIAGRLTELLGA